ncbi:MAG: hypothetical protein WCH98_03505 [Verrucomicrobiota bacterium]
MNICFQLASLSPGMNAQLPGSTRVPRVAVGVPPTGSPVRSLILHKHVPGGSPGATCGTHVPVSLMRRHAFYWVPVLLAAILLNGCASREAMDPSSSVHQSHSPDAAVLVAQSRSPARAFETRLGLAVAAADLAANDIAKGGGEKDRVVYNTACAEIAVLSQKFALPITLSTPAGTYRLESNSARSHGRWDPSYFSKLIPDASIKNKSLVARQPLAGFGGALVGVHHPPNPRSLFLPKTGVSAPVTAVLNTVPPAQAGQPTRATLELFDSSKQQTARIAGTSRPLATDLSAPFGYYPVPPKIGILGMLRPQEFFKQEGLFIVQPYDAKKIPLVFIHGLMSDPSMWLPVMADIEADPVLRGKYQFWTFAYPTGNPIGYSALDLRDALAGANKAYPKSRHMVIVNHSLGGVITHLQVISPGDALVKGIFKNKASEIMALPDSALLKRGLVYQANPRIDRVIFVAAPHRGAPLAINLIGTFGTSLIRIPGQMVNDIGKGAIRIAAADAVDKLLAAAGSVLLEPVMRVEVSVPEEHLGDVINDLQQRRAIITATEIRAGVTVLTAEAPLASMFGYSAAVRSVSQGRASFTMAPLKYGPAPAETADAFM